MKLERRSLAAVLAIAGLVAACTSTSPTAGSSDPPGRIESPEGPALAIESPIRATPPVAGGWLPARGATTGTELADPVLPVCTDGQAAAILAAEHEGARVVASAVLDRLTDPVARAYASKSIAEHAALAAELSEALTSAEVAPLENALSRAIRSAALAVVEALSERTGAELDSAYMQQELLVLSRVLGLADHFVSPSVDNPNLALAVRHARDASVRRLIFAHDVVRKLDGTCGGAITPGR
jgi:predicted outer membrane protein